MNICYLTNPSEEEKVELYELVKEVILPLSFYSERAKEKEIEKFTPKNITEFIKDDTHHLIVLKDKNQMVAFVSAYDDGDITFIVWYGVSPLSRGKGYGKIILNAIKEKTKWKKLWCDTNQKNIPSNLLLLKLGYKRFAEVTKFWYGHDYYLWELEK